MKEALFRTKRGPLTEERKEKWARAPLFSLRLVCSLSLSVFFFSIFHALLLSVASLKAGRVRGTSAFSSSSSLSLSTYRPAREAASSRRDLLASPQRTLKTLKQKSWRQSLAAFSARYGPLSPPPVSLCLHSGTRRSISRRHAAPLFGEKRRGKKGVK